MEAIISFFSYIQSLGVSVMMPIIIFVLALCFRVKLGNAIRSGLIVGVAFLGLNLVIGLLGDNLGSAVQRIAEIYGLELTVTDVGWPGVSAIAYASAAGALIIPLCLITNAVMLMLKLTQTMDVDIWNFWHYALVAAFVEILTGSLPLALFVAMLNFAIVLIIADNFVDGLEETNGLPGVSIPNAFAAAFAPIALLINKLLDKIPVIRDIDLDFGHLQEKLGVFGEPIFIGTVLGAILGIASQQSFAQITNLAITMGAVLVLIPKMAALLMDGLLPISEAAGEFMQKHFADRGKIYIGLDSAVAIGHPVTLSVSLILVPIVVFMAVIIPGNKMVPFVDLAVIPYMFALITPMVRGNGFRCLLIGALVLAVGLLFSTDLAGLTTTMAINAGIDLPAGAAQISSICDGSSPLLWVFVKLMELGTVGLVAITAATVALAIWNRRRIVKESTSESTN
jgi:PTS system galactitol-specific IIC component